MELPRINPVGLLEGSEEFSTAPRRYAIWQRWAVLAVLVVFATMTLVTTAVSLGSYCLTTDGGDTRALPWGAPPA